MITTYTNVAPEKAQLVLDSIKNVTELVYEGSTLKKISFMSDFGRGYLASGEYGSTLKLMIEEKPSFYILEEWDAPCDESLQTLVGYVLDQKLKFKTRKDAEDHIKSLKLQSYLQVKELNPNNETEKAKSYSDDLPF